MHELRGSNHPEIHPNSWWFEPQVDFFLDGLTTNLGTNHGVCKSVQTATQTTIVFVVEVCVDDRVNGVLVIGFNSGVLAIESAPHAL